MKTIYYYIKNNWVAIIISVIITIIITLIFGYFFLFQGQERVNIKYSFDTINMANVMSENQFIEAYKDNNIKVLSLTKIKLWNDGNKALNGKSILEKTPLRVELDTKYKILDIFPDQARTSSSVDYKLIPNKNSIIIQFDVLNPSDIIAFSVIHSGYSNDHLKIHGKWENFNGLKQESAGVDLMLKFLRHNIFINCLMGSLIVIIMIFSLIKSKLFLKRLLEGPFEELKKMAIAVDETLEKYPDIRKEVYNKIEKLKG